MKKHCDKNIKTKGKHIKVLVRPRNQAWDLRHGSLMGSNFGYFIYYILYINHPKQKCCSPISETNCQV